MILFNFEPIEGCLKKSLYFSKMIKYPAVHSNDVS